MKTKYLLLSLALLGLAVALVGCEGPHLVTSTPEAKATDVVVVTVLPPTHVLTPTVTSTLTPTPTPTPTLTPTPTVSPIARVTLTPQTETNLEDVGALLLSQTSHRFEIDVVSPMSEAMHISGIYVSEPKSIFIRDESEGQAGEQVIQIWDRFWANPDGKGWWPESFDDIRVEPPDPDLIETTKALHYLIITANKGWLESVTKRLDGLWADCVANVSGSATYVDGVPCIGYTWTDPDESTEWQIYLDTERGLPIQIVQTRGGIMLATYRFSHFNEPANVIESPTEKGLHSDDARMALNGLASFQWTSCMEWEPGFAPPENLEKPILQCVQGTWVQADQAWQASTWDDKAMSDTPSLRLLCHGRDCWYSTGLSTGDWAPADAADWQGVIQAAGPFWLWSSVATAHQDGTLVSEGAATIAGQICREYLYTWQAGDSVYELRLFVPTSSRPPLRAALTRTSSWGTLQASMELHHLDDPGNAVEPPPVW